MKQYDANRFVRALGAKLINGNMPTCPFCGTSSYTVDANLAAVPATQAPQDLKFGPSLPAGVVICKNCGHVDLFLLSALAPLDTFYTEENS